MRIIAALAIVASLFTTAAYAQSDEGICVSKDEIIAMNAEDGVIYRKVTDAAAAILSVHLLKNGISENSLGDSYVLLWKEGAGFGKIVMMSFDEHNCVKGKIVGPRDEVLKLVNGVGA